MPEINKFASDEVAMSMVRLFARHPIKEIEENPALIRELFLDVADVDTTGTVAEVNARILEKAGYSSFYCKVLEQKKSIETILTASSTMAQVKGILTKLSRLRGLRGEEQYKAQIFKCVMDDAIEHGHLWEGNNAVIDKYKYGATMIAEWVDFFLSYTNRNQPEVNYNFEPILKNKFPQQEWTTCVEQLNLIAKLLVRYIKERTTLNVVFYDKESMVCGDKIKDKVAQYCQNTFAFAQLIQWQIITDDGKKNWCYHEYNTFMQHNKNNEKGQYYFRVDDVSDDPQKAVDAAPEDEDWRAWLKSAISTHNIVIKSDMDIKVLQEECRKIGLLIRDKRKGIIDKYLASIN